MTTEKETEENLQISFVYGTVLDADAAAIRQCTNY